MLVGCSMKQPVPRTELVTVSKLEMVPVPPELTAPCLVPMPPLDDQQLLQYEVLPEYLVEVLGIVEQCNSQLNKIKDLGEEVGKYVE